MDGAVLGLVVQLELQRVVVPVVQAHMLAEDLVALFDGSPHQHSL